MHPHLKAPWFRNWPLFPHQPKGTRISWSPWAMIAGDSCCALKCILNWRKSLGGEALPLTLLQEGRGLALTMCGEAPWGLSRQALRRRQPLWALSPEFLQIIPQATSDWTTATVYCWVREGHTGSAHCHPGPSGYFVLSACRADF